MLVVYNERYGLGQHDPSALSILIRDTGRGWITMKKKCSRCGEEKELEEFCKNKRSNDGLHSCCRECNKKLAKKWRESNPDKVKTYNKDHYIEQVKWRKNNIERVHIANRKWDHKNREKESKRKKVYFSKRYHSDSFFKYKLNCRNIVHQAVYRGKPYKTKTRMFILLGCSFENLWEHLLSTWKNRYGVEYMGEEFNIDHIIPLATAETKEDIAKLCHYTNLQMLTPEDNRAKADKMFF